MSAIDKKEKSCTKCGNCMSTTLFYKQRQTSEKGSVWYYYDSMCKKCRLTYSKDRSSSYKQDAVDYKGGKCLDCGLIDDPALFDFHHRDATKKDFEIGQAKNKYLTDRVKKELDKCDLLCCMCHRRRHIKIRTETKNKHTHHTSN